MCGASHLFLSALGQETTLKPASPSRQLLHPSVRIPVPCVLCNVPMPCPSPLSTCGRPCPGMKGLTVARQVLMSYECRQNLQTLRLLLVKRLNYYLSVTNRAGPKAPLHTAEVRPP